MRSIIKVLLIFYLLIFSAFQTVNTRLIKLEWGKHFKGKPDSTSPFTAITSTDWIYKYKSNKKDGKIKIYFENEIVVDKNRSWVKLDRLKSKTSRDNLLHHEQGHINIQLLMVKEADSFFNNKEFSIKNYQNEIIDAAKKINKKYITIQEQYDKDTRHGSNYLKQKEWDEKIITNTF